VTKENDLRIPALRPDVIAIAADWAAVEGWDPGLAGTACFATVDPAGFLIGFIFRATVRFSRTRRT
jgi:hypothetical protein